MRVTSPAVTIKAIWDALVADYGVAASYGLLLETNLDGKVSEAKANVSALALEATLATVAAYLDTEIQTIIDGVAAIPTTAQRGTDSALLATNYKQFTKGLTEHAASLARAYADLSNQTPVELLSVSGAGYLTGIWAVFKLLAGQETHFEIVIEIDGSDVGPFTEHGSDQGNIANPATAVCFTTSWDADWKYVLMITPMWRFDSSLKIIIANNGPALYDIGVAGSASYVTE